MGKTTTFLLIAAVLFQFCIFFKLTCSVPASENDGDDYHGVPAQQQKAAATTTGGYEKKLLPRLVKPPPRNESVAICAVMKEEEAYIDEWVDYHLGIGFSAIYVYDNTDLHELEQWGKDRQEKHGDPVFVEHFRPLGPAQSKAYRHCGAKVQEEKKHKWIFFIDVDEFLVIKDRKKYPHVVDMLQVYCPRHELIIWWQVFGTSGKQNFEPLPVTKRFQYRVEDEYRMNRLYKSFIVASEMDLQTDSKSPHWFHVKNTKIGRVLRDTSGKFPITKNKTVVGARDVAALHHYAFKSQIEFRRRKLKGDVYFGNNNKGFGAKYAENANNGLTKTGDPIPDGTIFNDDAWRILKEVAPRYAVFDDFHGAQT